MHVLEFPVRPTELDSFGHVNNARYLEYLEWARAEWSRGLGHHYDSFRALGVIPAVVRADLRFQREARLGDTLRVETKPELIHSAKIVFHQTITNQLGQKVLKAEITVVAIDVETRGFTELPAQFLHQLRPAPTETP